MGHKSRKQQKAAGRKAGKSAESVGSKKAGKSARASRQSADIQVVAAKPKLKGKEYEAEIFKLQIELVKIQEWVKATKARVVIIFEGRDAAGKGGVIKRIMERVSPRVFRLVALPAPTDREKTQIYWQRYIAHLPSGGEVIVFDRSWYNRAGVEQVMGFCDQDEYKKFLRACAPFEATLVNNGIILLKYWLEVSEKEQNRRFMQRIEDPTKRWKLSPMDLESHRRYYDYSRARDAMLAATDTALTPWYIVPSDDKKRARLNCIADIISRVPYEEVPYQPPKLPHRQKAKGYKEGRLTTQQVAQRW